MATSELCVSWDNVAEDYLVHAPLHKETDTESEPLAFRSRAGRFTTD